MSRIYYAKPSIGTREHDYVGQAVREGWGERCYDFLNRFEKNFAEYHKVPHAIATSSCTGALTLALKALGVEPGDEVLVPEATWAASAAPVHHMGAIPVPVDIDPVTWCMSAASAEAAITPRTKGLIVVHLYGNVADMAALSSLAKRRGLFLIEDAAEGLGSRYQGQACGSMGDVGVFSFHGTKTLTTGEGGMLITSRNDIYERILSLGEHGRVRGEQKMFFPHEWGYKFKMSNIQAALGLAQLERLDGFIARKREIAAEYRRQLEPMGLVFNAEPTGTFNSYWMPTVLLPAGKPADRDRVLNHVREQGIDLRTFFYPLSQLPMCTPRPENRVAYDICARGINLPGYVDLSDENQAFVVAKLKLAMEQLRHRSAAPAELTL